MSGQKIKRPLNASEIKTKTDNSSNKKQKNIQKLSDKKQEPLEDKTETIKKEVASSNKKNPVELKT